MTERMPPTPAIVGQMSNLCLPLAAAATGGVGAHRTILNEIDAATRNPRIQDGPGCRGYDGGYEVTPTRILTASIRNDQLWRRNDTDFNEGPLYTSVHQGWAGNNVYGLVMQRNVSSIKVAERLGMGCMDAVMFGDTRQNGKPVTFADYAFRSVGVQLTAEVFEDWTIHGNDRGAYDAIPTHMQSRGMQKLVVDPYHLYRAHRADASQRINPEWVLEAATANDIAIDRVHFRAGNKDLGTEEDFEETEKDLAALLAGPEAFRSSQMGELAIAAFEIWQHQREKRLEGVNESFHFVNEVTDGALRAYHQKVAPKDVPYTQKTFVKYHARMIRHARKALGDARK